MSRGSDVNIIEWLTTSATIIAVLLLAARLVELVRHRNSLIVTKFEQHVPDQLAATRRHQMLHREIANELVSMRKRHDAVVDLAGGIAINVNLAPETVMTPHLPEVRALDERIGIVGEGLIRLLSPLLRPTEMTGFVTPEAVHATLSGRRCDVLLEPAKHGVCRDTSTLAVAGAEYPSLVEELAAKVALQLDSSKGLNSWQALVHLTRALELWAGSRDLRTEIDEIEQRLRAALRADPRSSIVNYNLGLVLYESYEAPKLDEAIRHFRQATYTDSPFYKTLGFTGLSRAHSQLYHRLYRIDELEKARDYAAKAVACAQEALAGANDQDKRRHHRLRLYRARSALAFATHATERPVDLRAGAALYEQLAEEMAADDFDLPWAVANNLGYVYMALGGRFTAHDDADHWHERARTWLTTALDIDGFNRMAHANLGNIARMHGDYGAATERYLTALDGDPDDGPIIELDAAFAVARRIVACDDAAAATAMAVDNGVRAYPAGFNELSRVRLELGDSGGADLLHRASLALSASSHQRVRLRYENVRAKYECGDVTVLGEAAELADQLGPRSPIAAWFDSISLGATT